MFIFCVVCECLLVFLSFVISLLLVMLFMSVVSDIVVLIDCLSWLCKFSVSMELILRLNSDFCRFILLVCGILSMVVNWVCIVFMIVRLGLVGFLYCLNCLLFNNICNWVVLVVNISGLIVNLCRFVLIVCWGVIWWSLDCLMWVIVIVFVIF